MGNSPKDRHVEDGIGFRQQEYEGLDEGEKKEKTLITPSLCRFNEVVCLASPRKIEEEGSGSSRSLPGPGN